ncbi:Uncharacterized protein y4eO [Rubellimicrobium mesophilum DSM 19309]|uniref:Uncharacterized protein y4eO n=1 Tax=Rubellimicrobium mesophilum DSM 19309 TaxID=442562 RepID=A0A017HPS7_9RHOB|nr:Uncharacterized protein y4eO [Rubellimicrobium mesophilum DSM 19309]
MTVREAAVVADVSVRKVHQMIDEGLLPDEVVVKGSRERRLDPSACMIIRFNATAGLRLSKPMRTKVAKKMRKIDPMLVEAYRMVLDEITIDMSRAAEENRRRLGEMEAAKAMVVSDPDVRGGLPVLMGTRLGVYEVAGLIEAGSMDEALAAYPSLTPELARAAVLFAKAHPRTGRPRKAGGTPANDAHLVATRVFSADELEGGAAGNAT